MKKLFASIAFIAAFTGYTFYQNSSAGAATTPASIASTLLVPSQKVAAGAYRDGTYVGSPADAYYGSVQVKVTVAGGKIADVAFLDYPHDRSTSRDINSYATPRLRSEALQAQGTKVSGVSGATDTSMAFNQSLASALSQARG